MFLALFLAVLVVVMIHVGRHGDSRDIAAGMVVSGQFILELIWSGNFIVSGVIFIGALFLFVAFSVKRTGALLGIISGIMALWAVLAFYGVIPSEKGAGLAFNYHSHITLFYYGQLYVLWRMVDARSAVRN